MFVKVYWFWVHFLQIKVSVVWSEDLPGFGKTHKVSVNKPKI